MSYLPATLEITTVIGCKIQCKYCPQNLLTNSYLEQSTITQMTMETFIKCIDKIPKSVGINFSGMAEPWLNPDCTDMVLYAARQGHPLSIYTTLVGMNLKDLERIKKLDYVIFAVHLPDKNTLSHIKIDDNYLTILKRTLQYFELEEHKKHFEVSCHGPIHPKIQDLISTNLFPLEVLNSLQKRMIDRAGNLDASELSHRYNTGPLQCGLSGRQFNRNILLPNGSILLCCMDYGMEVILGNLLEMSYEGIFTSRPFNALQTALDGDQEVLCRHCNNAIPWEPPYKLIAPQSFLDDRTATESLQFCAYLAQHLNLNQIACFQPDQPISFSPTDISRSVVFLPDINILLDHPESPSWSALARMMENTPAAVFIKPSPGIEMMTANERQLQINSLYTILNTNGLHVDFVGWTRKEKVVPGLVAILNNSHFATQGTAPLDFRVVALMATYNEEDIIAPVFERLIQDGIDIYLIDNESTDGTVEIAKSYLGKGLIGLERFSPKNPADLMYEMLQRKEALAQELDADWFINQDADEIRESPWPGIRLKDAIYRVDQQGYTCIDFTVLDFRPIDNTYINGNKLEVHFHYFEFGTRPGHFLQVKAWKKTTERVNLVETGGHKVEFSGAKVYPYKFLLRHFPIRSQEQGEKKIFVDRKNKFKPEKEKRGWHVHYDHIMKGENILAKKDDLILFDDYFYSDYLFERISGLGITPNIIDHQNDEDRMYSTPNKYAHSAYLEETKNELIFHGYQEFSLAKDWIRVSPDDAALQRKYELLFPFFMPRYLKNRSILDLGANAAFCCFWALQQKAEKAIAVDIDEVYLKMIEEAKKRFGFENLEIYRANVADWQEPEDIVVALALVHWIYSTTALFGSLDAVVGKLAQLTKYILIVEWIEPDDQAIQFFHHIDRNKDIVREPYTLEAFEAALAHHFCKSEVIGKISPTRKLYVAFRSQSTIDLSGPLPLILDREKIISSRRLAKEGSIEYWSCVYTDDKVIYKQASLDLAQREANFLSELNSDYFPKILKSWSEDKYSVVVYEKILGAPLNGLVEDINNSPEEMYHFIEDCLNILGELKTKGIVHRDIRPDNMLMRDGKPVLVDFGWAVSEKQPYFTPWGLGTSGRPPDGSFSDIYSMGKVFEWVNQGKYSKFTNIIELMAEPDAYLRVTDLAILKLLFTMALKREINK